LAKALRVAKLEAVVIGNAASMLNGAPVTTQDIDLLIRNTKLGASSPASQKKSGVLRRGPSPR
jgi:hypothetical protein